MNTQEKFTPTPYEVIEQKEVLHEAFAGLLADFHRLIDRDENNRKANLLLLEEARYIWRNLLSEEYNTLNDIDKIKGKYELFSAYVKGMKSDV